MRIKQCVRNFIHILQHQTKKTLNTERQNKEKKTQIS